MARGGGRGDPRRIMIAQVSGVASGYACRSRKDLDHDGAVAAIRAITTDPVLLSEAAGESYFGSGLGGAAQERTNAKVRAVLVGAGASYELIDQYRAARQASPGGFASWWT